MGYAELKEIFCELKRTSPGDILTAHVIFTEDSFTKEYSLLGRAYCFSSDNKAFWPHMFSNSIFAYCLDKTSDQGVRLDWYMDEEGNPGGWKVEDCYILEHMRDVETIPNVQQVVQEDGTVCYFFGDTTIRADEIWIDGKVHLKPISGDQIACGEWTNLPDDRLYGYCFLLEKSLKGGEKR